MGPIPCRPTHHRERAAVGLLVALLLSVAVVHTGSEGHGGPVADERRSEQGHEGQVGDQVGPTTSVATPDACDSLPEKCGSEAACDDPTMCGDIVPGTDTEEIVEAGGPCTGERCGDIGPGEDDGSAP